MKVVWIKFLVTHVNGHVEFALTQFLSQRFGIVVLRISLEYFSFLAVFFKVQLNMYTRDATIWVNSILRIVFKILQYIVVLQYLNTMLKCSKVSVAIV